MVGRGLQAEYYREPLQKPFRAEIVLEAEGLGARAAPTATSTSSCMPARSWASPA